MGRIISTSKTLTEKQKTSNTTMSYDTPRMASLNERKRGKAQRISTATIVSWQLPNSKSNDPKREQQKRQSNSTLDTFYKQVNRFYGKRPTTLKGCVRIIF